MSSQSGLDSSEEGEISASGYDTPIPPAQMRPSYHNAQWRDCLYTADGRPVSGSFMFREASIASYTSPNYYEPRSSGGPVDVAPTRPNRSGSNHRAAGAYSDVPAAEPQPRSPPMHAPWHPGSVFMDPSGSGLHRPPRSSHPPHSVRLVIILFYHITMQIFRLPRPPVGALCHIRTHSTQAKVNEDSMVIASPTFILPNVHHSAVIKVTEFTLGKIPNHMNQQLPCNNAQYCHILAFSVIYIANIPISFQLALLWGPLLGR